MEQMMGKKLKKKKRKTMARLGFRSPISSWETFGSSLATKASKQATRCDLGLEIPITITTTRRRLGG
jgi:hypothetical protein